MTNPTPTDVNTLIERLEALDAAATDGPWAVTSTVGDVHSQARSGQNWICQGPNLHAPSTPPVSEIHANAALVAEVRNALPDLIQALRAPTVDAAGVIMKASRCGHHFDDKCLGCQSALDCTNREMERLRTQSIQAAQALRAMQARVGDMTAKFVDSDDYKHTFYGILNKQGEFWTPLMFHDEESATKHLEKWAVGDYREMLTTHKIVPVRSILQLLPNESTQQEAQRHGE